MVSADATNPTVLPVLVTFSADGTYIQVHNDGHAGLGVWADSGPETVMMTAPGSGLVPQARAQGLAIVRAEITIDPSDDLFTMIYTIEFEAPGNGASSGQLGPATALSRRIEVQPLGIPDAPLSVLGTPEPVTSSGTTRAVFRRSTRRGRRIHGRRRG